MTVQSPESAETVDQNIVRMTAFFTVLLLLAGLFSNLKWIALLLCYDFFIRGFTHLPISPLRRAGRAQAKILCRTPKPVDSAPEIFAAKVECILCGLIAALCFSNLWNPARLLTELLVLLIGVEAFLGICVGTHLSNLWKKLRFGLKNRSSHWKRRRER